MFQSCNKEKKANIDAAQHLAAPSGRQVDLLRSEKALSGTISVDGRQPERTFLGRGTGCEGRDLLKFTQIITSTACRSPELLEIVIWLVFCGRPW